MKSTPKFIISAGIGTAVLALSAISASAAVVCTGNVCWHTHESYDYPASARVVVHEDNWKWNKDDKYEWREHEGRGYWSGDRWTDWK